MTRHPFHALCPYFAMFPESFAEKWISKLTKQGDWVLDPFSGRGTAPFQALLMARKAIATDVNPVAFVVTKAKTQAPSLRAVRHRLDELEDGSGPAQQRGSLSKDPYFRLAFRSRTLQQLLHLRDALDWRRRRTDTMIAALALGSLHGEMRSPSYFGNQMPRTISPKPAYSVRFWRERQLLPPRRDVFEILRSRADLRYKAGYPIGETRVSQCDMRELPLSKDLPKIRCVITSPPYLDVTSFEEDQWLRLWFLGGPPYPTNGLVSTDDRHRKDGGYWSLIADMWRVLGTVLAPRANIVIRIGCRRASPRQLAEKLHASARVSGRGVDVASMETSRIENRQTPTFRPGSEGCRQELDVHFAMR